MVDGTQAWARATWAASWAPDANPFPALDAGSAGYALSFDGMQDYGTAANANFPAAGAAQTIEMWIKYPL